MYGVYILECQDGSLYTGVATDVARRFKEHQTGRGARFTRAKKAVKLLYTERAKDRSAAQKREAAIKKLTRSEKLRLIASNGILKSMTLPKVGAKAPAFSLPDQDGKVRNLSDYAGTWVLLYFYPKDDTPGCTIEACTIRDQFQDFKKINAVVLGVSPDSVASHKRFKDAYELPFTLLADEDKKLVNRYGVWGEKNMMGRKYMGTKRTSFLIRPNGKIAKVYENVKPPKHAREVIVDIRAMT